MELQVTDNSKQAKDEMEKKVLKALTECGLIAERYAKLSLTDQHAVKTGLLRNSVTYAVSGQSPAIQSYKANDGSASGEYNGTAPAGEKTVWVGTNVHYAPYIEFGTYKNYEAGTQTQGGMAARPFIKPAMSEHTKEYQDLIKKELKSD